MVKTKKNHQQQTTNAQGGNNQNKRSKTGTAASADGNGNGSGWEEPGQEYQINLLESRKTSTGGIEGLVQWKRADGRALRKKPEWVPWDNLNELAQAQAAAWEKGKDENRARKMRAERRRKQQQQQQKALEEAGEGSGRGDGAAGGGIGGIGGNGGATATAGGTTMAVATLVEKSSSPNNVEAGKRKSDDAGGADDGRGGVGDENTNPEAKKKKAAEEVAVQEEEEEEEEKPAATPYDVTVVVQCREARSRQTLTLPSDSTIGFVKRDYIKARGHALSLELFDSLVFFYKGYPVTDGLVLGIIATPGETVELHIRF